MAYKSNTCSLPASIIECDNNHALTEVNSDGFATTVLPVARAGASLNDNKYNGKFHGLINPATPTGSRVT
jgi:hypothetical protein